MAEKKKGKQRRVDEEEKPTKQEYAVAKFLRFGLPVREGKMHGMDVKCFFGNAAVDKLLESKWSATNNKKDPIFTNRASCVTYLVRLLEKGLFHRAEREKRKRDKDKEKPKKKRRDKDKEGEKEETGQAEEELRERKGKKKGKKEETAADEEGEKKTDAEKKGEKKDEKKKKEKRLKLVMPDQQLFADGDEVYVWIYDPVNAKTFLIGLLMVLGAIALCMFPLWPEEVRIGVYYLSLAAAGFVGFILSLVVVRLILFCCVWVLTLGRHHFWFLPNLTEDVGFFDSFRPLYKHDYASSQSEEAKSSEEGGKKKKKEKGKGEEKQDTESPEKKEKSSDKDDSDEFEVIKKEDVDENGANDNENANGNADVDNDDDVDDDDNDEDDYNDDDDDDNIVDDEEDDEENNIDEDDDEEEEDSNVEKDERDTKKTK